MAKTKQQKQEYVDQLSTSLKDAPAAVFANFQGLTVSETEELRAKCRAEGVAFTASKKTLLKHALTNAGVEVDTKAFEGGVGVALAASDEVAPAQIVANFAKDHEVVTIFGGLLEGAFIDTAKVNELAKLPSKQELYAKLVGSINAPVSGFVNVLAGNVRGLVNVLSAIKDQKA